MITYTQNGWGSAHNALVLYQGMCPWCGGNIPDTSNSPCPEPSGEEQVRWNSKQHLDRRVGA